MPWTVVVYLPEDPNTGEQPLGVSERFDNLDEANAHADQLRQANPGATISVSEEQPPTQ